MTQDFLLGLGGMQQVGEGHRLRAVGMKFGYPIEVTSPPKGKTVTLAVTVKPGKFKVKELSKRLKEHDSLAKRVQVKKAPDEDPRTDVFLVVISPADESDAQSLYEQTMSFLEKTLPELPGFEPPQACVICQTEGSDILANYTHSLSPVHRTCLESWHKTEEEKYEKKKLNPGGPNGFIGGLLGALVGALPAFLVLWFMNEFWFILFALIPLGSMFGWRLLGGTVSKSTTVTVVLITFVMSAFIVIVNAYLVLYEFWGGGVTFGEIFVTFFDATWFVDVYMRDTLMALGAAVFGLFLSWRFISTTDEAQAMAVQSILEEAVPIN